MSAGQKKVHLMLSVENIAFLHGIADASKISVGAAADLVLTAAREQGKKVTRVIVDEDHA